MHGTTMKITSLSLLIQKPKPVSSISRFDTSRHNG